MSLGLVASYGSSSEEESEGEAEAVAQGKGLIQHMNSVFLISFKFNFTVTFTTFCHSTDFI